MRVLRCLLLISPLSVALVGCFSSSSSTPGGGDGKTGDGGKQPPPAMSDATAAVIAAAEAAAEEYDALCEKYPDVPRVEISSEIDGIQIPRNTTKGVDFEIGKAIPADVGNDHAAKHPAEATTGGKLTIRFNAEPKTMNPITETSSYQTYIQEYTHDALARQNAETLEYEPKLASRWITEDAVKLSADYPGHVRRIRVEGGEAAPMLEVDAPVISDPENPPAMKFETLDESGQALGNVWVGFYPLNLENMPGAPANGAHQWSDRDGKLEVAGLIPGKYRVHVGDELYGATETSDDGALTVRPATDENPLKKQLADAGEESLRLQSSDFVDVQRQTVFTYYLRPEAKWSDGRPFTTQDLQFGYHVIRNPLVDGDSIRTYYADLIECTPLTPTVVRMKYREQYFLAFEFTYALAAYTPPWHVFEGFFRADGQELTLERLTADEEQQQKKVSVHGEAFAKFFNSDARYNENPLGTGPYVIDRWNRNDSITLKRRNNYWDSEDRGYLDEIVFKFIPDNTTSFQSLRAGEIDFDSRMTPEQFFEDFGQLPQKRQEELVKAEWFSPGFSYVGWNILQPEFQDARVRVALALLFDTQEWIEKKLHGGGVAVSGSQYIFGKGYDHSVLPLGYDPEAAKELLEQAGWVDSNGDGVLDRNGKAFRCEILLPSGSSMIEEQMAVLQKNLKQVGIDVSIQTMEWASYLERIQNKDFDICRLSWSQSLESDPFQLWHSSGAGVGKRSSNHCSYSNPEADKLIEMLRVTLDDDKRKCIHDSFHRMLDRDQPYMFLYTPKEYGAYHRKFRGVKWYPLRPGYDLREWWIAKEDQ
ncbi:MAG: ABC transporter substrate-binding protein [Planctomycetaceae bacterium]|nr:ABC transporter substrate-binding protein [Planctomycetaceae bacterium]